MQATNTNTMCGQAHCTQHAMYTYEWPGRGQQYVCETHAAKVTQVGEALGMSVRLARLPNFTNAELKSVLRLLENTLTHKAAKQVLEHGRIPAKTTIVCEVCYSPIAVVDDSGVAYAYADEMDQEEFALLQQLVNLQVINIALQDAKLHHCPHCVACLCGHCDGGDK